MPALILHEISHLAGASEAEAIQIQKIAIAALRNRPLIRTPGNSTFVYAQFVRSALHIAALAVQSGGKLSDTDLHQLAVQMESLNSRLDFEDAHDLVLIDAWSFDHFAQLSTRVFAMSIYLCSISESADVNYGQGSCKDIYLKAFGSGAQRVSVRIYRQNQYKYPILNRNPLAEVWVDQITGPTEMARQLNELVDETDQLLKRLERIFYLSFSVTGCQHITCLP